MKLSNIHSRRFSAALAGLLSESDEELTVAFRMRDVTDIDGRTVLRLRQNPEYYESWEAILAEVESALGAAYEVEDDGDAEVTLRRVDRYDHLFDSES